MRRRSDGDQRAKQALSSKKCALAKKDKYLEIIIFDPVPNLDEVIISNNTTTFTDIF